MRIRGAGMMHSTTLFKLESYFILSNLSSIYNTLINSDFKDINLWTGILNFIFEKLDPHDGFNELSS